MRPIAKIKILNRSFFMRVVVLGIFYFVCNFSFAQDTIIKFLDQKWKYCKEADAVYIRKLYKEQKHWIAIDYYLSMKIQGTGCYLKKNLKEKDGLFTWYHRNGGISKKVRYEKNRCEGEFLAWDEAGNLIEKGIYKNGNQVGIWEEYYPNSEIKSKVNYIDGHLNGECNWFFENGKVSSTEIYENDELKSVKFKNEDGSDFAGEPKIEIVSQFPGGLKELMAFVSRNVVYSAKALEKGIKGRVIVKFAISEDGEVANVEIFKSVHPLLDNEALRVMNLMPTWVPGKSHNLPVKSYYILPINFKY